MPRREAWVFDRVCRANSRALRLVADDAEVPKQASIDGQKADLYMTKSTTPLVADQLVDCMANGRDPTVHELSHVAERIWTDGADERSAFGWGSLAANSSDRLFAFRSAQVALVGS
jgi:hypothetical protein